MQDFINVRAFRSGLLWISGTAAQKLSCFKRLPRVGIGLSLNGGFGC